MYASHHQTFSESNLMLLACYFSFYLTTCYMVTLKVQNFCRNRGLWNVYSKWDVLIMQHFGLAKLKL